MCPDGCPPPPLLIVDLFGPAECVTLFRVCPVHIPCVLQITAPKIPLIVFGQAPAAELSICGRETGKGNGFRDVGPDSSFPAQASAALGEIREDQEMEWVWIREEQNAGQGQGKAEWFDCFRRLRAALRPS